MMVYILGGNPQATYLAHILSRVPKTPRVRLLLFSKQFAENWRRQGSQVQILRPGKKMEPIRLRGEIVKPPPNPMRELAARARRGMKRSRAINAPRRQPIIQNLVVTEACVPSIAAIARIRHRLDNNSTICLVQPGLGVVERLNELYFPDPETRPRYILAHMTHDLGYTNRPFTAAELKPGKLILTLYPPPQLQPPEAAAATAAALATPRGTLITNDASRAGVKEFAKQLAAPDEEIDPSAKFVLPKGERWQVHAAMTNHGLHLLYLLGVAPTLGTGFYRYGMFLQRKLPAMIALSASETIATVLDLPLGDAIMHNGEARALLQGLVTEMIDVVRALPETRADPKLLDFVTSGRLERHVNRLLHRHDGKGNRPVNLRRLSEPLSEPNSSSTISSSTFSSSSSSSSSSRDSFSGADRSSDGSGSNSSNNKGSIGGIVEVYNALGKRRYGPIVSEGPCKMAIRTALGRRADVQFLNGYFVRRGREVGVACPMNEMVIRLVQARRLANQAKRAEHINIERIAAEDVREMTAYDRARSAQRKKDVKEGRKPQPAHASAAGKFPWQQFAQDDAPLDEEDRGYYADDMDEADGVDDLDGADSADSADVVDGADGAEDVAFQDRPSPVGQSSLP